MFTSVKLGEERNENKKKIAHSNNVAEKKLLHVMHEFKSIGNCFFPPGEKWYEEKRFGVAMTSLKPSIKKEERKKSRGVQR